MCMFGSAAVKVKIDRSVYDRSTEVARSAGYASTEEFIMHALEQVVDGLQRPQDAEEAKKQLRGLGYVE